MGATVRFWPLAACPIVDIGDDYHISIKPKNLYTVLFFSGVNVPSNLVDGKNEYEHPDYGKFAFDEKTSELLITPNKGIEWINHKIVVTKTSAFIETDYDE